MDQREPIQLSSTQELQDAIGKVVLVRGVIHHLKRGAVLYAPWMKAETDMIVIPANESFEWAEWPGILLNRPIELRGTLERTKPFSEVYPDTSPTNVERHGGAPGVAIQLARPAGNYPGDYYLTNIWWHLLPREPTKN